MRLETASLAILLASGALFGACSGGGGGGGGGGGSTGARVGPAGGTLTLSGGIVVEVPPGAVTQEVEITVRQGSDIATSALPYSTLVLSGTPYQFEPAGLQFAVPVRVTLPYQLAAGVKPMDMMAAHRDDTLGGVELLPPMDETVSSVTLSLHHFSTVQAVRSTAPAPTVTSVSPSGGPLAGNLVTIHGSDFRGGTPPLQVFFGDVAALATGVTVVSSTEITAVAPSVNADAVVDVTVKNSDGPTGTLPGAYRYGTLKLFSVSPASASVGGSVSLTISGTGFYGAASVTVGGLQATNVVVTPNSITCDIGDDTTGPKDVVVTAPDGVGATLTNGFVRSSVLTSITPAAGPAAGGTAVTVRGAGFIAGTAITISGAPLQNATLVDSTTITGTTPPRSVGTHTITLTNAGGNAFLRDAYHVGVTLGAISPAGGPTAGGTPITITGTGFTPGTTFTLGGTTVTGTVQSLTTFTGTSPAHGPGLAAVAASNANGSGALATGGFYYGPPAVSALVPALGFTGGGTSIRIVGEGFDEGTTVTIGGQPLQSKSLRDAEEIEGVVPPGAAGAVDVVVTGPGGATTLAGGFEYRAFCVDALSPDLVRGGTIVTIHGGGFDPNPANDVVTFGGQAAVVLTATPTRLIVQVPPAPVAGAVAVTVASASTNGFPYQVGPLRLAGPSDVCTFPAISRDGRIVAFKSDTPLDPGYPTAAGIFAWDRLRGTYRLVSVSSTGLPADGNAARPAVSGNGRFVAFQSTAKNLVPGDPATSFSYDVFVHDLRTGKTVCASVNNAGQPLNTLAEYPSLDDSGRWVAFNCQLEARKAYLHDLVNGTTTTENGFIPRISPDGQVLTFASEASLTPDDNDGTVDVYVRELGAGTLTRVTRGQGGAAANGASGRPVLSADGRYVAFSSEASNLIPNDTNGKIDIFSYDRQTGDIVRVSTDVTGAQATGRSDGDFGVEISGDGRYVGFFSEAPDLVANDTNGAADAFVKDLVTGQVVRINVGSAGEQVAAGARAAILSGDGRFATFESTSSVLSGGGTSPHVFVTPR